MLVILLMPTLQLVQARTVALVSAFVSFLLPFLHLFLSDLLNVRCIVIPWNVPAGQQPFGLVPFGAVVPRFLFQQLRAPIFNMWLSLHWNAPL